MGITISPILLSRLSEFMAEHMGLHFPRERWPDLERGICAAAREFNFEDMESCLQWLISSHLPKSQVEVLASHLTVGETYFFREKKSFEILQGQILPELIRVRRQTEKRLRLWSAGCATGEEPYSLAILLNKLLSDLKEWNITILATDINPRFLQKASEGVYSNWSFRDTPLEIKERYFKRKKEECLEVLAAIKKMVTFSYLNLAEDTYPSLLNNTNAMDIIFCRNVLMYFTAERAQKAIQNLYRCLVDGGWLLVSPSETSHVLFSQFVTVSFPDAILYKKASSSEVQVSSFQFPVTDAELQVPDFGFQIPGSKFQAPDSESQVSSFKFQIPRVEMHPGTLDLEPETRNAQLETLNEQGTVSPLGEQYVLSARACANGGDLLKAYEWGEKAIAADKLNPGYHYLLATILQEQGEMEKAIASLKRALYLDPNFVLAHFALGNLSRQQGKFKESEKHFENALSLLSLYRQEEILPESDGMPAGRLREIITGVRAQGPEFNRPRTLDL